VLTHTETHQCTPHQRLPATTMCISVSPVNRGVCPGFRGVLPRPVAKRNHECAKRTRLSRVWRILGGARASVSQIGSDHIPHAFLKVSWLRTAHWRSRPSRMTLSRGRCAERAHFPPHRRRDLRRACDGRGASVALTRIERDARPTAQCLERGVGESELRCRDVLSEVRDRRRAGDQQHVGRAAKQPRRAPLALPWC
jgi:hypothetical protein